MIDSGPAPVSLRYELTGVGRAEATLTCGDETVTLTASYLFDALKSLTLAATAVALGQPSARAQFEEEPGEFRWLLERRRDGTLRVRILKFDEFQDDPDFKGQTLIECACEADAFGRAVLSELRRLMEKHGELGYRELWNQHPFPKLEMQQLANGLQSTT